MSSWQMQLQIIQQVKTQLLERISNIISKNQASNVSADLEQIENFVLQMIESVDNILKSLPKKNIEDTHSKQQDRDRSQTPRKDNQIQLQQSYWRDEYTAIYKKWDYQNRHISRLQTQIEQLQRDQQQPSEKKINQANKLRTLHEKQQEILELQDQQNQFLKKQLIESQKQVEELNRIIHSLQQTSEDSNSSLQFQVKQSQTQIESLSLIIQEQEKEIEKLNDENTQQSEKIQQINFIEGQSALNRMSRVSNAYKQQSQTPQHTSRGSFSEVVDTLNRQKSFSFQNKKLIQSFQQKHQDTIQEEEDENKPDFPNIIISGPNNLKDPNETKLKTLEQENSELKSMLAKVKRQYEKRIEELELHHEESDSEASSEQSLEDLRSQNNQYKQDLENLQEKFNQQEILLKSKNEQYQEILNRYQMRVEDFLSRLYNQQLQLWKRNSAIDDLQNQSLSLNEDEETKRLEQSMKTNMKRMLMMKDKMTKLKANLEDYGEKIGIMNGRKRNSVEFTLNAPDQSLQISELIQEILRTIDSMNEVQKQIQDDYTHRIQKESDKQVKLVQQTMQLKSELRKQQNLQDDVIQLKQKIYNLEQELLKAKLDNHNLNELLIKNQRNGNKSLKLPEELEYNQRLNSRSSTISVQNNISEKQGQEIQILKKENQEQQELINKLYKQLSQQSPDIPVINSGRVSMIGQGFETSKNDKQTQYLSKRVADLQKKLDIKSAEFLQETQRSQQLRIQYEEIVKSLEDEMSIRDVRLQELHQLLLESQQS